ncbi:uncharacterized protein EI90DRAFT_346901 [Cantharellus anzutake]|uniref:uncharacterized protein n=1 Tax=Cantharellus anzutake TaxID=1750568 RepID=UPI0019047A25|nr:uncharacterized protein EI90DRAFT_346901 [Cantharellus anzutake]KAF8315473.1 hypothetical protein EI90DRAFT_346901 [Cantharellus anzutake]
MPRVPSPPPTLSTVPRHVPYEKNGGEKTSRSRNGCLTCRIRRKVRSLMFCILYSTFHTLSTPQKCTELKDPKGFCEACSRLGVECLGYAEKRPVWMKVSSPSPSHFD